MLSDIDYSTDVLLPLPLHDALPILGPAAAGRPLRSMSPGLRCAPASSFTYAKRPPGRGGARLRCERRSLAGFVGGWRAATLGGCCRSWGPVALSWSA